MAHIKDVYRFSNSNEYEYKYAGNYGAKGEKRYPKRKASEEQIRKQNQINRVKKVVNGKKSDNYKDKVINLMVLLGKKVSLFYFFAHSQ